MLATKQKTKLVKLDKLQNQQRLSQSMVPKTTDINQQQETLLPEINVTKKGMTQLAPVVRTKRERPNRQVVVKPQPPYLDRAFDTDGGDTDGGGAARSPMNSTDESVGINVMQNGAISLQ